MTTWVRRRARPLAIGEPSSVDEPYRCRPTFGWAADWRTPWERCAGDGDASSCGAPPAVRVLDLCLWNQFLHTFNFD
jgi:hypothetical protein